MNWEWLLAAKQARAREMEITIILPFNDSVIENKCLQSWLTQKILETKVAVSGNVLLGKVK